MSALAFDLTTISGTQHRFEAAFSTIITRTGGATMPTTQVLIGTAQDMSRGYGFMLSGDAGVLTTNRQ